ncbi:MAG: hypothetical protein II902_01365 [Selenomonadaceae bacterium]|nr:hypothetical protein [Selenomonadaceae bacterium]
MIHICFGLYDKTGRYSKFTGTTMLSVFENSNTPPRSTTVHILHDNTLTLDNREKFLQLAARYDQAVNFYNVDELCRNELEKFSRRIPFMRNARTTIGTFYKFLIMYVLPKEIEKVIYLDADIVVNLDIAELWQVELGARPLGAVPVYLQDKNEADGLKRMKRGFDLPGLGLVKSEDYFNAGVLVMNLKRLRGEEKKILDGMKFRGEHPEFRMFDQCIWNYCFSTEYLKLPLKFNRSVVKVRTEDGGRVEKKIYHFTANNSFWSFGLDTRDGLNRLWLDYFIKTPWFDSETFGRIHDVVQNLHASLKNYMRGLSVELAGKGRAFIIHERSLKSFDVLAKAFSIRADEKIIVVSEGMPLQKLLDAMNASRGKKIFFVVIPNFPFHLLKEAGFVRGKDFLNGYDFLSGCDFYKFVEAM